MHIVIVTVWMQTNFYCRTGCLCDRA